MILIDSVKEHWEIRYKDIDPDTGDVSNDKSIAISLDEQSVDGIVNALNLVNEEPNRRYYKVKINAVSLSEIRERDL